MAGFAGMRGCGEVRGLQGRGCEGRTRCGRCEAVFEVGSGWHSFTGPALAT
jgi:hypothetical protein